MLGKAKKEIFMWLVECPRCNYESSSEGFDAVETQNEEIICSCPECGVQFQSTEDWEDVYIDILNGDDY
jgi:transcription elongation factor Elf1